MSSNNLHHFIEQSSKQNEENLCYCSNQQTQKEDQKEIFDSLSSEDLHFYETLMKKIQTGKLLLAEYQVHEIYPFVGFYLRKDGSAVLQFKDEPEK